MQCIPCYARWQQLVAEVGTNNPGNGESSSDADTATCQFCGRTFKAGTSNYRNVEWANMCNNCEDNYKSASGLD